MSSRIKTFVSITVVIGLTTIFHYVGWLAPIENFIRQIINPMSSAVYSWSIKVGDDSEKFNSVEELQESYKKVKEELLIQQVNKVRCELFESENKELRDQLNFLFSNNYKHVGAQVIGKNIDPLGSTLLINMGFQDGVEEGNPVIISDGVLVGIIDSVEKNIATVRLINDNRSRVAAAVLNQDKTIGLVEGGFAISVQMNYIPQNEQINIGDMIVTSGLSEQIPPGLLIGTVEIVEREAYQPFQRAVLTPVANLEKVTLVSVLTFLE